MFRTQHRVQPADSLGREVATELQVGQTVNPSVLAAVVYDGLGLIEIYVRMATQHRKRLRIEVYTAGIDGPDSEIRLRIGRETFNLVELVYAYVTAQSRTITQYCPRIIGADAGHTAQYGSVGAVKVDVFALLQLDRIAQCVAPYRPLLNERCRRKEVG